MSTQQKIDMSLDAIIQSDNTTGSTSTGQAAAPAAQGAPSTNGKSYGKKARGPRSRSGRTPYNRGQGQAAQGQPAQAQGQPAAQAAPAAGSEEQKKEDGRQLKISSGSNPKTVAGAISHISRQGECPSLLATGAASINQAIKAVAISRGYLEENKIELTCYPEFRTDKRTGLHLALTKGPKRPSPTASDKDVQQLKVSKGSNPNNVAGAIANKLRDGQRVWVLAIGADSVTHAVKAISIGRKYLESDGLDISFRPEFTKVKFDDGRDCSALKLVVLAQQI